MRGKSVVHITFWAKEYGGRQIETTLDVTNGQRVFKRGTHSTHAAAHVCLDTAADLSIGSLAIHRNKETSVDNDR